MHLQAEVRQHRPGQKRPVEVYYMHAPGTTDDRAWRLLQYRIRNQGLILNGREIPFKAINCSSTISEEEIKEEAKNDIQGTQIITTTPIDLFLQRLTPMMEEKTNNNFKPPVTYTRCTNNKKGK